MTGSRIWVFAEGSGDHGPTDRDVIGDWGVLQHLVRSVTDRDDLRFTGLDRRRLPALGPKPPASVKAALARKAHKAALLASADGCEAIVLHSDTDDAAKVGDRTRAPAALAERRSSLADGVAAAGAEVAAIYAVPVATTEAWLLADHTAVEGASGDTSEAALKKWPETLWGHAHQPSSDHPKMVFNRATDGSQETRQAIAETSSVTTLEERCPLSFAPFAADVRAALRG